MLLVQGAGYDPRHRESNEVLGEVTDPELVSRLGEFLRLYEADESYQWMTPGSPTIVLCQGSEVLAAVICIFP